MKNLVKLVLSIDFKNVLTPSLDFMRYCKGPSINDVASLKGGRGVKLTTWGDMRGVGLKENSILSIQDSK